MNPMHKAWLAIAVVVVVVGVPMGLKAVGESNEEPQAQQAAPVRVPQGQVPDGQQSAVPRFLDLGTTSCAPCKAMLGVMQQLETRFAGQLDVQFVNVQGNPAELDKYGVRAIPTQIFCDPAGKELFRHTGFLAADAVVAKFAEFGFKFHETPAVPARQ